MPFLIAVALQIALIASELFVLRAFTDFAPTQEWALQLFWNRGGAAALCTAVSAHLIMLSMRDVQSRMHAFAGYDANFPISPISPKSTILVKKGRLGPAFMRVVAMICGCTLVCFSLLTIASASIEAHKLEQSRLAPLFERVTLTAELAGLRCEPGRLKPTRAVSELRAILESQTATRLDKRDARREMGEALAAETAQQECLDARAAHRAAEQQAVAALPPAGRLLRQIVPGVDPRVASTTYPIAQGIVAWLILWLGSFAAHAIAKRPGKGRSAPGEERTEAVRADPPAGDMSTPMGALNVWLQLIEVGSQDATLREAREAYERWCERSGAKPASERTVKEFYKERCAELGIPWKRVNNKFAHRGIRLP